jgi:putative heme transporter
LWLRPQLLGHQLRLHPGVVFVSLIGGLALSGVFGALVAVPLIASVKVVGHYIRCKLLDLPPWPDEAQQANGGQDTQGS